MYLSWLCNLVSGALCIVTGCHKASLAKHGIYTRFSHIAYAVSDLHLIQLSLSHELEKLSKCIVSERLTLNATKTEFMLIGSGQSTSDTLALSIVNFPIERGFQCEIIWSMAFPH